MQVYEKRPSGLAPDDLRSYAAQHRGSAAWAAVRTLAGLVLFAFFNTSVGVLLFLVGLVLLASTVPFVRRSADAAIKRPAVLLTNRPRWDGVRRKIWEIDAGDADIVALGAGLARALDVECGDSLTTFDEEGNFRGDTRNAVFSATAHAPGQLAWSVDGRLSVRPTPEADGVWVRIERIEPNDDDSALKVTIVTNEGEATERFKVAAARTAASPER
ncbi:MAG: hypothetical protein GX868_00520 [Actinobacteria bacterium]|nr:hypothetical protein [Actinomycetota bacterium]